MHRNAEGQLEGKASDAIDIIARNPRMDVHIKELKENLKHMYRFRVGDLRMLYEIDDVHRLSGSRPSNGEDRHANNRVKHAKAWWLIVSSCSLLKSSCNG
jgi:hypothetical protein